MTGINSRSAYVTWLCTQCYSSYSTVTAKALNALYVLKRLWPSFTHCREIQVQSWLQRGYATAAEEIITASASLPSVMPCTTSSVKSPKHSHHRAALLLCYSQLALASALSGLPFHNVCLFLRMSVTCPSLVLHPLQDICKPLNALWDIFFGCH